MRVIVFAVTTASLSYLAKDWFPAHPDEVWLGAAVAGFLLASALYPVQTDRWKWRSVYVLLIIGLYLTAFKLPHLVDGIGSSRLTSMVLSGLYLTAVWFLTRKWRSQIANEEIP